ncbi:hypothetical protein JMJ55_22760 [Belnapia sp. T6]|uniref:Uncharacterized protein n=1 Tax=Belnapia mucosa TaxID=2804532 RepID=A0ABS1VBP6_9PROT|nr:hypothetical protein [Belnapia mucosa]MBL6458164.1 hypothetical protein [Belnapia mucosa]
MADQLVGGPDSDGFLFQGAFGHDVVWDFTQGEDKLGFSVLGTGYLDLADLHIAQIAGGTFITVEDGTTMGSVALAGFTGTLTQADLFA